MRRVARSPQLPKLLFSAASFVRIEIWVEFAPTQQHAKRAKGKNARFHCDRHPRFSIITYGEREHLHQPPCYHA